MVRVTLARCSISFVRVVVEVLAAVVVEVVVAVVGEEEQQ